MSPLLSLLASTATFLPTPIHAPAADARELVGPPVHPSMVVDYWDEELEEVYQYLGGGGSSQLWVGGISEDQVVPPTGSVGSGTLIASLNTNQTALRYFIRINPALTLPQGPPQAQTDISAIHLHLAPAGQNGPHGLNVFGFPSQDDRELNLLFGVNGLTGRWDDGDETGAAPNQSKKLTDNLTNLFNEAVYVQMHTVEFPSGAIRGQFQLFP